MAIMDPWPFGPAIPRDGPFSVCELAQARARERPSGSCRSIGQPDLPSLRARFTLCLVAQAAPLRWRKPTHRARSQKQRYPLIAG